MGQKLDGVSPFFWGGGSWVPIKQSCLGQGLPPLAVWWPRSANYYIRVTVTVTKWHISPSSRLATVDIGCKLTVLHWKVYTWAATLCGVGSTRKQEEEETGLYNAVWQPVECLSTRYNRVKRCIAIVRAIQADCCMVHSDPRAHYPVHVLDS